MEHNKSQMYGMSFNPADYAANLQASGRNTSNSSQSGNVSAPILPGNQNLAYQNMLPLLYQNQMLGLGMQPGLFYGAPFSGIPPVVYNQNPGVSGASSILGVQSGVPGQNVNQSNTAPSMSHLMPGILTPAHLQGFVPGLTPEAMQHFSLPVVGHGDHSKYQGDKKNGRHQDHNDRHRGSQRHDNYREASRNDHRGSKEGNWRNQRENSGKGSPQKDKYGRGNHEKNRQMDIDPNTGKLRDRESQGRHTGNNYRQRRESIEEANDHSGRQGFQKGKDDWHKGDKFGGDNRGHYDKERRQTREFEKPRQDTNWNRRKDSESSNHHRDFKRRDSREREKHRHRERDGNRAPSRDRDDFREGGQRRDRNLGGYRDSDKDIRERGRNFDKFNRQNDNDFKDRRPRYEDQGDFRRNKDRFGERDRDDSVGKFMIINKPMDNIEGNSIPKDRPVSYICFDSNMPRRAVVLDMVKHKIGKYFLPEQQVEEVKSKEPENEQEEAGLSEEEDLYHLTFKNRYFNDFVICQNCFKEGHEEKRCPERFRNVCWMCLGNHNKDECVNIACFRCNGSGHKNSNCPMRDTSGLPLCPRCKKRSHTERDCNMLSLSFGKASAEQSEVICFVCGERGHAAGVHCVQPEPTHIVEEMTRVNSAVSKDVVDDNGQLKWQDDDRQSEADDELPALYEPKESLHRESSTAFQTLDTEASK